MGILMMSKGTGSETGQTPGTLAKVARGGRNLGFWVFSSTPFWQWTPSRMGAWAFLGEESHSSPRSGRSLCSDVWLGHGSDSGIFNIRLLGDTCWVSVLHSVAVPLYTVESTPGRCP